jgi:hypothetical protein
MKTSYYPAEVAVNQRQYKFWPQKSKTWILVEVALDLDLHWKGSVVLIPSPRLMFLTEISDSVEACFAEPAG